MRIIQASSLSPTVKQQYAEILAQATNTDPLYQTDESDKPSDSENNQADDSSNAHELVNNTSQAESDLSGGRTSAGVDPSTPGDAKSASESQSSSQSSSSAGESDVVAYELSPSTSKSVSSEESSMPIFVIIAIIALIAIFLVGYVRNQKDDFDDY